MKKETVITKYIKDDVINIKELFDEVIRPLYPDIKLKCSKPTLLKEVLHGGYDRLNMSVNVPRGIITCQFSFNVNNKYYNHFKKMYVKKNKTKNILIEIILTFLHEIGHVVDYIQNYGRSLKKYGELDQENDQEQFADEWAIEQFKKHFPELCSIRVKERRC